MAAHVDKRTKQVARIEKLAVTTLARRLGPETAREISASILNLSVAKVRPHIKVAQNSAGGESYVSVSANKRRLPLTDFGGTFSPSGFTVTTWKDQAAKHFPHIFKRKDARGAWQRIPTKRGADNRPTVGLVGRLPIVTRKGPSMHRVFDPQGRYPGHGDLIGKLSRFKQLLLVTEITRLFQSGA